MPGTIYPIHFEESKNGHIPSGIAMCGTLRTDYKNTKHFQSSSDTHDVTCVRCKRLLFPHERRYRRSR